MTLSTFNWQTSLIGGVLIGLAAVMLMALNGRIAGISGIVGATVTAKSTDRLWRLLFVCGLVAGVGLATQLGWAPMPNNSSRALPLIILAAALVGVGTAIASGCTSGHGVCGLSRGSVRSLVATAVFMGVAAATVYVMRHLLIT